MDTRTRLDPSRTSSRQRGWGTRLAFAAMLSASLPTVVFADDEPGATATLASLVAPPSLADALHRLVAQDAAFKQEVDPAHDSLSTKMRLAYDELSCRLDDELRAQFVGLSSDSLRSEWLRRYWKLLDPTPTTPENELQVEHAQRVEHVRAAFYWPLAPYWDDRGKVYILLGAPDQIVEEPSGSYEGVGYVANRLDWMYGRLGVVVRFVRLTPSSRWTLNASSIPPSSRPDVQRQEKGRLGIASREPLDPDLRTMLVESDPNQLLANASLQDEVASRGGEILWRLNQARNGQSRVEAGRDHFALPGASANFVPYVFGACAFRGEAGRMRLEIHTQVDLRKLRFARSDSLYAARYRCEAVLQDEALHDVARDEYEETIPARSFATTQQPLSWPGQLTMAIPAGTYRLIVRLRDLTSGDEGVYVSEVRVRDLASTFALSDLEMATQIVDVQPGINRRFTKGNRMVVPNPSRIYPRGRTLIAYWEMYGLDVDRNGRGRYRVHYSIGQRGPVQGTGKRAGRRPTGGPVTTSTFELEATGSDPTEELRIDVGNLEPGSYDLLLTVSDLTSGAAATTPSTFVISK